MALRWRVVAWRNGRVANNNGDEMSGDEIECIEEWHEYYCGG